MSRFIATIAVLFSAASAHAVQLPAIPEAPSDRLPIEKFGDTYDCSEIALRLSEYNNMARQHDQSITAYLGQVIDKLGEWYNLLEPLEGKNQTLATGTFQPLQEGAGQMSNITDRAFDNSELLAGEMDRILTSLQACKITNAE